MSGIGPFQAQVIIRGILIQQSIQVAVSSVLVYDTLLTVDKEFQYFWTHRWHTLSHILFFVNRYFGVISTLTGIYLQTLSAVTKLCDLGLFYDWIVNIGGLFSALVIDYILVIRIVALWGNNNMLSIALKTIIFCEGIVKLALTIKGNLVVNFQATVLGKGVTFCGAYPSSYFQISNIGMIDWLTQSIIGFTLMTLALYKAIIHWKETGWRGADLTSVIVKDQIIYYLAVLFCSVINIVNYKTSGEVISTSNISYVFAVLGNPSFLCLLGSRISINLKEAGEATVDEDSSFQENTGNTLSDPHFAGPAGSQTTSETST
ncbi:hypothetical protein PNOK_0759900 [Pyrrhoderma noxium]|uniref:DUF6533 domain-containing protein n=1 Tax=Pyrrhoderma noxium TaxID=2282107 RepID=A0A286UDD3_9AGAM|nr:hypothetical protein PNOK_0759900 [Pyrrhoderma noxium]